jgi:hypothetical protein
MVKTEPVQGLFRRYSKIKDLRNNTGDWNYFPVNGLVAYQTRWSAAGGCHSRMFFVRVDEGGSTGTSTNLGGWMEKITIPQQY